MLFQGSVLFKVDDETYLLKIRGKDKFVKKVSNDDLSSNADLTVLMSKDNMIKLLSSDSKISPQQAFMKGMLKVKGKVALAMKLTVIFAATKKNLQLKSKL